MTDLEKERVIQVLDTLRTPNRQGQKRNTTRHITVKIPNMQNKREY
jgi:hypothetical protein